MDNLKSQKIILFHVLFKFLYVHYNLIQNKMLSCVQLRTSKQLKTINYYKFCRGKQCRPI